MRPRSTQNPLSPRLAACRRAPSSTRMHTVAEPCAHAGRCSGCCPCARYSPPLAAAHQTRCRQCQVRAAAPHLSAVCMHLMSAGSAPACHKLRSMCWWPGRAQLPLPETVCQPEAVPPLQCSTHMRRNRPEGSVQTLSPRSRAARLDERLAVRGAHDGERRKRAGRRHRCRGLRVRHQQARVHARIHWHRVVGPAAHAVRHACRHHSVSSQIHACRSKQ